MAKVPVGLDIGTSGVHAVQVSSGRGQPTVTNFGGVALPQGAVREGEVTDIDAVAGAIRKLWVDAKISEKAVWLGVSNQRVVVRQIDLPYMEDAELRSALRFSVQEFIPIPVDDAELDYQRLDEFTTDDGARQVRILLVAAHKEMVTAHVQAAVRAGLRPVGVDLNSFAVIRALAPAGSVTEGSEVLVDIGAGVTNIVVHDRGIPRFVRILVLGGGDITEALATGLNLSYEDAEATKLATGIQDATVDPAARIVTDRANQFVDEVRGSLDYYLAQTGATQITRVVLSGGGSKLFGLADRVGAALRLPVALGRPLQSLPVKGSVYGPEQLAEVEPLLATAIGLAVGGAE